VSSADSAAEPPIDVVALLDEIRALARTGLHYAQDPFDRARYEHLLDLASKGYADVTGVAPETLRTRFLAETGYVTAKVGADGAAFDDKDRILLVRRADDGAWGLVAGWVDPNESPEATLVREFREEVGLDARVERLAGAFYRSASGREGPHSVISLVYLCSVSWPQSFTYQPHEVLEAGWYDIDEISDWHLNHERLARGARDAWWRVRGGL
jgi:ADP-ribose pyrophosphatase YjhB (NUDIX family)